MKRKPNDVLSCGPESVLPDDGIPAVVMWDINSPDSARARAFYRDVFGWKVSEPGAPPVRLATVESGGIQGVLGQAPKEGDHDHGARHKGLIVYIKVPDVAAALGKIESRGGKKIGDRPRSRRDSGSRSLKILTASGSVFRPRSNRRTKSKPNRSIDAVSIHMHQMRAYL